MIIGEEPVKKRWLHIKEAFNNFDVHSVAHFTEKDIDRILKNQNVIPNRKKISATIRNAEEFEIIIEEFGSIFNYMKSFRTERQLIEDLDQRVHYLGKPSLKKFIEITRSF